MSIGNHEYKILNRFKINGFICMITDSQIKLFTNEKENQISFYPFNNLH
jgi:hypothetical protein